MERRAASHTEEEEMNHRRRLLNAAKKGDQKAIGKLLELYQVRIYSGDMVTKLNKTSATHKLQAQLAEGKPVKGGPGSHGKKMAPGKPAPAKRAPVKVAPPCRSESKGKRKQSLSRPKPLERNTRNSQAAIIARPLVAPLLQVLRQSPPLLRVYPRTRRLPLHGRSSMRARRPSWSSYREYIGKRAQSLAHRCDTRS